MWFRFVSDAEWQNVQQTLTLSPSTTSWEDYKAGEVVFLLDGADVALDQLPQLVTMGHKPYDHLLGFVDSMLEVEPDESAEDGGVWTASRVHWGPISFERVASQLASASVPQRGTLYRLARF